jgi:hypothetical protein
VAHILLSHDFHIQNITGLNVTMKLINKKGRHVKHGAMWYLTSLLLWFAAVSLSPTSASATISVPIPDHDLIEQSVAIVVGQVIALESYSDLEAGMIFTLITLSVDDILKGNLSVSELTIKQPGGKVEDRQAWVFGSPEFTHGEKSLLFLTYNEDGTLRVAHLYQGKFSIMLDAATGKEMVSRDESPAGVFVSGWAGKDKASLSDITKFRELESFKAKIRAVVDKQAPRPRAWSGSPILVTAPFATGMPEMQQQFHIPGMSRWFEPDDSVPVKMRVNAQGEPNAPEGGFDQIIEAYQAWSTVADSSFRYQDDGFTDAGGVQADGVNAISFGDPLGQMDPPIGCTGVLAFAGFFQDFNETRIVNDQSFFRIVEGDVVFNSGWEGCGYFEDYDNLSEVATHELGHVLGLGHSDDPNAIMYRYPHFEGWGGTLGADDIDGLVFLYPATTTPPGEAILLSPSGKVVDLTPVYIWNTVPGATWYYLWVNDNTGNRIKKWYKASDVQSGSDMDICTVTPDVELETGVVRWWVRTWNANGYGPWSDPRYFIVEWEPPNLRVRPSFISFLGQIVVSWDVIVGLINISSIGQLQVSWDGIAAPASRDWLGLFEPFAADTEYLAWRYTSGDTSGTLPFLLPARIAPGTYELRLFANNGYNRLATSNTVTVLRNQ